MKSLIRNLIPSASLEFYRRLRRSFQRRRNRNRPIEEVFTDIYLGNRWGGAKGQFCSGNGSTDDAIVSSYVSMVAEKSRSEGFRGRAFVDLGCGDFHVGRQLLPFCSQYAGADIVKPLIARNQEEFGSPSVRFVGLNIVEDALPEGDVCFVRQVFQHLSNRQILAVLPKLRAYRWVFITEHYPTESGAIRPNKDKVPGADIRLYDNSAVYLCEPPFDLPRQQVRMVLEVEGSDLGAGCDRGVIRTFLYKPAPS